MDKKRTTRRQQADIVFTGAAKLDTSRRGTRGQQEDKVWRSENRNSKLFGE